MRPIIFVATSLLVTSASWAQEDLKENFPKWAKSMSADSFAERDAAQESIRQWALKNIKKSEPLLNNLFESHMETLEPEVRLRCYKLMEEIVLKRKASLGYGYLGVHSMDVQRVINGKNIATAKITNVAAGTPAAKGGLKVEDHIFGLDDHMFSDSKKPGTEQLSDHVKSKSPGDEMVVHIDRNGKLIQKKVTLADFNKATAGNQNGLIQPRGGMVPQQVFPQLQLQLQQGNGQNMPKELLQQLEKQMQKAMPAPGKLQILPAPGNGQNLPKELLEQLKKMPQPGQMQKEFKLELNLQGGNVVPPAEQEAEGKQKEDKKPKAEPKKKKENAMQIKPQVFLNGQAMQIQPGRQQVFRFGPGAGGGIVQLGGADRDTAERKKAADENYFKKWYAARKKAYEAKRN